MQHLATLAARGYPPTTGPAKCTGDAVHSWGCKWSAGWAQGGHQSVLQAFSAHGAVTMFTVTVIAVLVAALVALIVSDRFGRSSSSSSTE